MISNPGCGWCKFQISEQGKSFEGHPSYLTDVPVDLLEAFLDFYDHGYGMACFDEEGSEFTLVLTEHCVYVIERRGETILHTFDQIDAIVLAKELTRDIERNLDEWASFTTGDEEELSYHRQQVIERLVWLKELLNPEREQMMEEER